MLRWEGCAREVAAAGGAKRDGIWGGKSGGDGEEEGEKVYGKNTAREYGD